MVQYIDKDALVVKIERRKQTWQHQDQQYVNGGKDVCDYLLGFLDTLEVKEVDLDKEIKEVQRKYKTTEEYEGYPSIMYANSIEWIAIHFFELGFKAQHDNWKVVDDINLPQVGRNIIYCVFTKQKYILATVINHPQDEDLLQWKCTEFPYHRYDMCEGDKYMQIV